MKKIKKVLVSFLICAMTLCVFPVISEAASKPSVPKQIKSVCIPNMVVFGRVEIPIKGVTNASEVKISNLKYSKSILTPYPYVKSGNITNSTLAFSIKKAGTTKVSFKLTVDGKSYNCSTTVKLVNYTNPFKSIKVGKKNYTSKFNIKGGQDKLNYNVIKNGVFKGKLQISLKSGWKLVKMYKVKPVSGAKKTTVKNNTTINLGKKYILGIVVKNTKTGVYEELGLNAEKGYAVFYEGYFK